MMKKLLTTLILLFAVCTLSAQSYSACYTSNMNKGNAAYSKGRYSEAKTYYTTAKKCEGGNPAEAQKKINACDAKIRAAKEAAEQAEEQARLEREAREKAAEQETVARAKQEKINLRQLKLETRDVSNREMEKQRNSQNISDNAVTEDENETDDTPPVYFSEIMPEFPGGPEALNAFIQKEIHFPENALENGITGTVLVQIVIEKNGSVSNAEVKVHLFPDCDQEALRVIEAMPKWKPASSLNNPVRCFYQVPISFTKSKLEQELREKAEREAAEQRRLEQEAREKAEREAAEQRRLEQEAREKAEREAAEQRRLEQEAREKAEREAAEQRRLEQEAREKAEREAAEQRRLEQDVQEKAEREKECLSGVQDIDGNKYNTVFIGRQCWMAENLRTRRYADGTLIPVGSINGSNEFCRYYPNDNRDNVGVYGYLYNWMAVMGNASSFENNTSVVQGICPNGWHVPSDAEWKQLTNYVSSQSRYICGGNKQYIAKALSSSIGWNESSVYCFIGHDLSLNNATGFSAVPAGIVLYGGFSGLGSVASFWSATQNNSGNAYNLTLNGFNADVNVSMTDKKAGFSVRCLKD